MSRKSSEKSIIFKVLVVISGLLLIFALGVSLYDIVSGDLTGDQDFGAGNYYYTDVPGWEKIFLYSPSLGFENPVVTMALFLAWGYLMYRIWMYVEKKSK